MADKDKPKRHSRMLPSLNFNIGPFLRKKTEDIGKPNASGSQDASATTTNAEVAGSVRVEATTTEVPKAETEDEANSPTVEGLIGRKPNPDDDGKSTSLTSVNDKVLSETQSPDNILSWNVEVGSKSQLPSIPSKEIPTTQAGSLSVASLDPRGDLWDTAYDSLKPRYSTLLYAYERMIHSYLARNDIEDQSKRRQSSTTVSIEEDSFPLGTSARRRQMDRVVRVWLIDHDNPSIIFNKETLTEEDNPYLQNIMRSSLRRSAYASLPWAAACLAVENIFHRDIMPATDCSVVIEIISRMEWYISLARLPFGWSDEDVDESPRSYSSRHMKESMIALYKAILLFTIEQSVASTIQRNQWELPSYSNSMGRHVLDLEEALLREIRGSTIRSRLSQLLDNIASAKDASPISNETDEVEKQLNDLKAKLQPIEQPRFEAKTGKDDVLRLLYSWASNTEEYKSFFQQQPDGLGCRVLWVTGPPGAGKSMLMKTTTKELSEQAKATSSTEKFELVYFFCDSRDQSHGYVTRAIKSLIWQILQSRPSLAKHVEDKFHSTGRDVFNDPSDFYAMSTVLYRMLDHDDDTKVNMTYVIVDAIEELCVDASKELRVADDSEVSPHPDLAVRELLRLIIKTTQVSPRIKWLVSVDHDKVAPELTPTNGSTQMKLEINDNRYFKQLQGVTKKYIASKVSEVAKSLGFREPFQSQITAELSSTAPNNFLWVDMACSRVESHGLPWNASSILDKLPKDIKELCRDAYDKLSELDFPKDQDMCRDILSTTAVAYRNLHKSEVESLVGVPACVDLNIIVSKMCAFFLELYNESVCYVHPAVRDFVRQSLIDDKKISSKHFEMAQRCLKHATQTKGKSKLDTYAITNWMRHMCEVRGAEDVGRAIQAINQFFNDHFLEWVEILATQGLLSEAIVLLQRLGVSLQNTISSSPTEQDSDCLKNIQQALWLFNFHRSIKSLGNLSPKYSLPFLPSKSELRQKLLHKALPWLDIAPEIDSSTAIGRAVHVLEGHGDWVRCCCYSLDGRLIASGGDDGIVRLWDAETVKVQHTINLGGYVHQLLFTSDQRLVALLRSTIEVWDASTGMRLSSLQAPDAYFGDVHSSPDGKKLVAAKGNSVVLFDIPPTRTVDKWVESRVETRFHSEHDPGCVMFSPDGALIAYTLGSKSFLYNTKNGKTCRVFDEHQSDILGLAFWPDSKYLATGSADTTVRIWETYGETYEKRSICILEGHKEEVNCVSFSSKSSRLASGSSDSTIRIWVWNGWSSEPGNKPYTIEKVLRGHDWTIYSLDFRPDGKQLISSSSDGTVRVWDINASTGHGADTSQDELYLSTEPSSSGHSTSISFIVFSPNGKLFASASSDGRVCLWDCDTGCYLCSFTKHEFDIMWLDFSRDGSTLVSASKDCRVCVWDTCRQVLKYNFSEHSDWVRCAVISPDGNYVASASDDMSVRVWNISNAEDGNDSTVKHRCFNGEKAHRDYVYAVAFSPLGDRLASGGDDLKILIWNLTYDGDQEAPRITLNDASEYSIRGLAFTEDQVRIVSCEFGGMVRVWNTETKACEQIIVPEGQFQLFRTIQFAENSPNTLITEIGAWQINMEAPSPSASSSKSDTTTSLTKVRLTRKPPRHQCSYGVSNNREWITWKNKDLIFLPTEYRPSGIDRVACRVQDLKVVIGSDSGEILFFKFSEKHSPYPKGGASEDHEEDREPSFP